jgi:hypothetical protein
MSFSSTIRAAKFKLAVVGAFHSLSRHPKRFKRKSASSVAPSGPHAMRDLARRYARRGKALDRDLLKDNRVFVTCQNDDDIAYILKLSARTTWSSAPTTAIPITRPRSSAAQVPARRKVSQRVVEKMLDDNPRAFMGWLENLIRIGGS